MKTITAYRCSDGSIFEIEVKAKEHQNNIIGEMLDGLLPHDDRGNVTSADRFSLLTKIMDDPQLKEKINELYKAINHGDDELE